MKPFWVRFSHTAEGMKGFEYHGPWWVSGEDLDDNVYVCAAVMATDEDAARRVIVEAHDDKLEPREWSFANEKPASWNPISNDRDRFRPAPWMHWPWPPLSNGPHHTKESGA